MIDHSRPGRRHPLNGLDAIGSLTQPNFTGLNAGWEGTITASRWTGINIYASAHRLRVPWIRGRGMSSVLRTGGWDKATGLEATYRVDDVKIGTILFDQVEFGIAVKATNRLVIDGWGGTYGNTATAPRPPHALYFADSTLGHRDPRVGSGVATGGIGGQAYQIKGCIGGSFGALHSRDCMGSLNVMDVSNVEIAEVVSWGDLFNGTQGGSLMFDQGTTTTGVRIGRVRIDMAVEKAAFNILNGTKITVDDMEITTAHTTTGDSNTYDVVVGGSNNTLRRVSVVNTGALAWRQVGTWGSGTGNRVTLGRMEGGRIAIDSRTSPDVFIGYDPDLIKLHATDFLYPLATGFTGAAKFVSAQNAILRDGAVVADNFELASGGSAASPVLTATLFGQDWTQATGVWRVDGGNAHINADLTSARAWVLGAAPANARVSADVTFQSAEGLVFRAIDSTQFLSVRMLAAAIEILSGTGTVLATVARTNQAGRKYHLAVSCYGDQVEVFLNGQSVLTHTLSAGDLTTYGAATGFGLRTSKATGQFRNFKVVAL